MILFHYTSSQKRKRFNADKFVMLSPSHFYSPRKSKYIKTWSNKNLRKNKLNKPILKKKIVRLQSKVKIYV